MQISIDNPTDELRIYHGACAHCGNRYFLATSHNRPAILLCTYCNQDGIAPRIALNIVDIHKLSQGAIKSIERITMNETVFV